MGVRRLINLANPTDVGDITTRSWVDSAFVLDNTYQSRLYADTTTRTGKVNMAGYRVRAVDNAIDVGDTANMQDFLDALNAQSLGTSTEPAGVIRPFGGSRDSAPAGYLWCNGEEYAAADFPNLASALGSRFGSSDPSYRFKVPDLRGRLICGLDNLGASDSAGILTRTEADGYTGSTGPSNSNTFGDETVTLTTVTMASHTHPFVDGLYVNTTVGTPYSVVQAGNSNSVTGWDNSSSVETLSMGYTGDHAAHENLPPLLAIRWIICIG
jgi:microcystin-dependent protein